MTKGTRKPRRKPQARPITIWAVYGVLFAVALAAYWNSFHAPMVFDDTVTIKQNAAARFGEISWYLLSARSVLYLTFTLNYMWTAQEVWGYHLVNFLLHVFNGLLVFTLAVRLFLLTENTRQRARIHAAFAAAFFLVHPVQTESVTYISSRSELLSTFFYLIAFLIFTSWPQRRAGVLCSLAVAVPFFFGLGSKETAVSLPATLLLYDFLFWSGAQFRLMFPRWRFYVVNMLGGVTAIYYILYVAQRRTVGSGLPGHLSTWQYFLTELRVIVRYVELVFLPVGLNLDYDFTPSTSLFQPAVIGSLIFLSAIVVLGWTLRRRSPVFAFSIFWFFITLSPTSSVVPIKDVIFEHRLYLPLVGVCLSLPLLVELVFEKLRHRIVLPGRSFVYSSLIIVAFIAVTVRRNYIWNDEVRLFTDVVAKSPDKERPYNLLGLAYNERGEPDRAMEVLEAGVKRLPGKVADFSDTLGNLYLRSGRLDDALELYKKTIPHLSGPRLALAYNNIGAAHLYKWNDLQARASQLSGDELAAGSEQILKASIENYSRALEIDPNMFWTLDSYINASSHRDRGTALEATALKNLRQKLDFQSLYIVGKVAFNNGDYARADKYFAQAENLRKEQILFFNHGYALGELKQEDRAIEKYLEAIHVEPLFTEAYNNMGLIYMGRHDYDKAFDAFSEVFRQDPRHLNSNLNLASIYISRGDKALARKHLQTALEVSPEDQAALAMLRQLGG